MSKNYGLPYMGSKNKIAEWVVAHIPQADTLVDLFAGGCAVTDCAMRTKKWRMFIVNDMPSEFSVIAERPHRSRLSATSNNFVMERLYGWNVPSRPKYFQFSLF